MKKLYSSLFVLFLSFTCFAQTTWDGSSSTAWNTPANWDDGVPDKNTDAILPDGMTNQASINAGLSNVTGTCKNLDIQGDANLLLSDGLSGSATLNIHGNLNIANSTSITYYLNIEDIFFLGTTNTDVSSGDYLILPISTFNKTNNNSVTINDSISFLETVTINVNNTVNVENGWNLNNSLTNEGTLNFNGGVALFTTFDLIENTNGTININSTVNTAPTSLAGTVNINSGGHLTIGGDVAIGYTSTADITINSGGTLTIATADFDNAASGSITINSGGTLIIEQGFSNPGTIINAGTLTIDGGTLLTNGAGNLTNTGTININGSSILDLAIDFENDGTININSSSTLDMNANELDNDGAIDLKSGGALTITNGGILNNNGTLTVSEDLAINNGVTLNNNGTIINNETININTGGVLNNSSTSAIASTININGTGALNSTTDLEIDGIINVNGTGTLNVNANTLNNDGTININANTAVLTTQDEVLTSGTINLPSVFTWTIGGLLNVENGGIINANTEGTITCNGAIDIDAGGVFTLDSATTLTANSTVVSNGTLNILDDASFLQDSNADPNPTGTGYKVSRHLPNNQQGDPDSYYTYWGAPVTSGSIGSSGQMIVAQRTTIYKDGEDDNKDFVAGDYNSMVVGKGYGSFKISSQSDSGKWGGTFTGTINNGDIPYTLTYGTADEKGVDADLDDYHYNFVANPYPSAISAADFITHNTNDNDIYGTIYVFSLEGNGVTARTELSGETDYIAINLTGATSPAVTISESNSFDIPEDISDFYIASCQGFMVIAQDPGTTTNTISNFFRNDMRVSGENSNFKSGGNNTIKYRFWLELDDEEYVKSTLLGFSDHATLGEDILYDAPNYYLNQYVDIWTESKGAQYEIQCLPRVEEVTEFIPVGIKSSKSGIHHIRLPNLTGWPANQAVYLFDQKQGVYHDLKNGTYDFYLDEDEKDRPISNRFYLTFIGTGTVGVEDGIKDNGTIQIVPSNHKIYVSSSQSDITQIEVMDTMGRVLLSQSGNGNSMVIDKNFGAQNCIIKVALENGEFKTLLFK